MNRLVYDSLWLKLFGGWEERISVSKSTHFITLYSCSYLLLYFCLIQLWISINSNKKIQRWYSRSEKMNRFSWIGKDDRGGGQTPSEGLGTKSLSNWRILAGVLGKLLISLVVIMTHQTLSEPITSLSLSFQRGHLKLEIKYTKLPPSSTANFQSLFGKGRL